MTKYAAETTVAPAKTRTEIETTLERFGATAFGYTTSAVTAQVAFEIGDLRVRFTVKLPQPDEWQFRRTPTGLVRSATAAKAEHEKAVRQRWRALLLVIKAKCEAVESGIETAEQAWFSYVILPNGATVFEEASPAVAKAMTSGAVGPLIREDLPALGR